MAQERFQAGKMDRRVKLQQPVEIKTPSGAVKNTFQDLPESWAARKEGNGTESVEGKIQTAIGVVTFTIRYRDGITEKWRLVSEGITYDILHIAPVGRRHLLDLKCQRHQ